MEMRKWKYRNGSSLRNSMRSSVPVKQEHSYEGVIETEENLTDMLVTQDG